MTVRGKVKDGRVEVETNVVLPEGAEVLVMLDGGTERGFQLSDLSIEAEFPGDLASEHDHYLYGTPKKSE